MTAANPSIAARALDNFGSLGFRLRVYALVLPLCVAVAVILDIGFGLPTSTIALTGIALSILLLIAVPIMYTAWQRKRDRNRVPDPEYPYSMADLRRMQATFIKQYSYYLHHGAEEMGDPSKKLLDELVRIFQLDDYLHRAKPKGDLIEQDKETHQGTILPLEQYLDYLSALVTELDPEPQRLLQVVIIIESLNRTAEERWELEPQVSVVYRRALHDIAQALDAYVMKNLASVRQVRVFRQNYERQHGRSAGFGAIVDPHGTFDPTRQRS